MRKRDELDPNNRTCMNTAHPDELVFVLLGRDPAAPFAIRAWTDRRIALGKNLPGDPKIEAALSDAAVMELEGARWKGVAVPGPRPTAPDGTRPLDAMIGRLDRLLSEFLVAADAAGSLDEADRQTLKHHADDLIGVGNAALKRLARLDGWANAITGIPEDERIGP